MSAEISPNPVGPRPLRLVGPGPYFWSGPGPYFWSGPGPYFSAAGQMMR
jgi:hypothetical protein